MLINIKNLSQNINFLKMNNKKNKIQRKERDKLKNMSSLIQVNLNES